MEITVLPKRRELVRAFLARDSTYKGVFVTGVRSTGIFCSVGCPARTPREEQLEFFATTRDALAAGFRPCRRCRPMEREGQPPDWLRPLLAVVDQDHGLRWTDADIRALKIDPDRVRRWFQKNHGMTFHTYARARRLGLALHQIRNGASVTRSALDHGYDSMSGFHEAFRNAVGTNPKAAKDATIVYMTRIQTPLGPMLAGATDSAVCLLEFADRRMLELQARRIRKHLGAHFLAATNPILEHLKSELDDYFGGAMQRFTVPIVFPGSEFQQSVWRRLQEIPFGQTASYTEIAAALGVPRAVRAVARANGDNRIAILIPCHRVIGAKGDLTGYAGGLWRKKRLLTIELSAQAR